MQSFAQNDMIKRLEPNLFMNIAYTLTNSLFGISVKEMPFSHIKGQANLLPWTMEITRIYTRSKLSLSKLDIEHRLRAQ